MSDGRRRRSGPTGFSSTGNRTALGYWVPLAVTVTAAAIGLAAWVWSERGDDDDEEDNEGHKEYYGQREDNAPFKPETAHEYDPSDPRYSSRSLETDAYGRPIADDASMISRVQGALRRSPSPQQIFDGASKRVAAGVAAAGAAFGGALSSIREEDRGDFEDHSRWTEEANARAIAAGAPLPAAGQPTMSGALPAGAPPASQLTSSKKRKTVAIVVSSAVTSQDPEDPKESISEHAVCLSLSLPGTIAIHSKSSLINNILAPSRFFLFSLNMWIPIGLVFSF